MYNKKIKKGFTLIEILVIISIISFVSTSSLVVLNNVRKEARDTKRKTDLKAIVDALELYYDENNTYPVSTLSAGECDTSIGKINCLNPNIIGDWSDTTNGLYELEINGLLKLPIDPMNNPIDYYQYQACQDGQSYIIKTVLEKDHALYTKEGGNDAQILIVDSNGDNIIGEEELDEWTACYREESVECAWRDWNKNGMVDLGDFNIFSLLNTNNARCD